MTVTPELCAELRERVRLVALDLDGTTLTDDKRITPRTRDTLRAVVESGVQVAFATGRMLGSAVHYAGQTGLPTPHVALNGSLVGRTPDVDALFCGGIPRGLAERSLEHVPEGVSLYWLSQGAVVAQRGGLDRWSYLESWNGGVNELEVDSLSALEGPIYQLHYVGPEDVLNEVAAQFKHPLLQRFLFGSARGPLFHLEVRRAGIDKGTGLEHLAQHLNVSPEHTLAIGDWLNDLELVQRAGYGAAMKNACQPLKDVADFVLERSNAEEGVADFLERVFLP